MVLKLEFNYLRKINKNFWFFFNQKLKNKFIFSEKHKKKIKIFLKKKIGLEKN